MPNYEELMKKCLYLAIKARGKTSPNPLVGCLVLDKNGQIISEGYHHKYGDIHAERDALLKISDGAEKGGTLIVNLEPCSHWGKTPPCADLIIERGIKRVIIGCKDNNPKVNGGGIKKLTDAGIEVVCGVLENDCRKINEIFFTDIEKHRTFIALKTATTLDGKIATENGDSKWITSEKSRQIARNLRSFYDAILTSSSTVIADNPNMEHKLKIILDNEFKTDFNLNIYKTGKVILVIGKKTDIPSNIPDNVDILQCPVIDNKLDLNFILDKLYNMNIKSVFVEAGGKLLGEFIKQELADKIYQFIAPKILNDNNGKSCFDGDIIQNMSKSKRLIVENIEKTASAFVLSAGCKRATSSHKLCISRYTGFSPLPVTLKSNVSVRRDVRKVSMSFCVVKKESASWQNASNARTTPGIYASCITEKEFSG